MSGKKNIVYRVNDQDKIVYVNEEWDAFASANKGEAVASSRVLHRSLWDFIADSATREIYREVLKRIREGRDIQFSLRCDSPDCRRLLEMDVSGRDDGTVEFRTHTISEDRREPVELSGAPDDFLRVCGWCKKIFLDGVWVEVEDAVAKLRVFNCSLPVSITHGICDECLQQMSRKVNSDANDAFHPPN